MLIFVSIFMPCKSLVLKCNRSTIATAGKNLLKYTKVAVFSLQPCTEVKLLQSKYRYHVFEGICKSGTLGV